MNAAKPQFNGPLAQFKVQRGKAAVQGSKFNAPLAIKNSSRTFDGPRLP
jgi:hypothetical protein